MSLQRRSDFRDSLLLQKDKEDKIACWTTSTISAANGTRDLAPGPAEFDGSMTGDQCPLCDIVLMPLLRLFPEFTDDLIALRFYVESFQAF
jgi:hypothetical protein